MTPIDPRFLAMLRRFDTPTVLNVIELFDVRPRNEGFLDGRIRAIYPRLPPTVGYATTATFRSARAAEAGDAYSDLSEQVRRFLAEVPEPRIVVFEDLDDPVGGATFGEVMCTVYKAFGCVGLVTSGAARDIEQVERLAFPCFASTVIASHSYCRIVEVNVPVTVGGVRIAPGDLLHADANGVATVPEAIVPEVALGCRRLVEAENEVLHYAAGTREPAVEGLREAQKRCRQGFASLPEAVRRELGGMA
jgi:regulator of RNase E activity RraA